LEITISQSKHFEFVYEQAFVNNFVLTLCLTFEFESVGNKFLTKIQIKYFNLFRVFYKGYGPRALKPW